MKRYITTIALVWLAAGLALPVMAQKVPTTTPGPHSAQISGELGQPARDLFGVHFVAINGTNIQPRSVMWLEPGTYTLTVQIHADHVRQPRVFRDRVLRRQEVGYNRIDVELEAGKTYEIRALYDRNNRDMPFSVVLHQVKER